MQKYTYFYFAKKYRWRYILGVVWLILVDILQLIVPSLLGDITDKMKYNTLDLSGIIKYSFIIIGLAIGTAFFRFIWRYFIFGTARRIEKNLRESFYEKLQSLSTRYFHNNKTGDLMAHATNDINAIRMALGPGVVMLADAVFLTIATVGILLFTIDLRLTLLALIPLPFLSLIAVKFGKKIHQRFLKVQESFSNLTDKVQENFSGIRVVKAFSQENEEIDKFSKANRKNFDKNVDMIKISGLFNPLVQLISGFSFLIVIWYGGMLVIRGTISLGDFVAFNSYLAMLTWPMMALGFVINRLQRGAASLDRINAIFSEEPDIYDGKNTLQIDEIKGRIECKNLTFKYEDDEEYVLKDINLNIESGETVAILGRTGSGKSTLVNLLLHLYNTDPGQLLIDGEDINRIPLAVLRESIGYVPQDNFLFSSNISRNIAFSAPDKIPQERIEQAARDAEVYDNIIEFPNKFDTLLGERGVNLSGGQKQRISISRALIKDPEILILDDSLSAVDTHTEELILNRLKEIMENKTSIIISHRISTIKDADKIFVLDDGYLIERGDHESLLKNQKLYYELYQKQQLEEKIANS
jgi:ATP-binding cassette subfamily B protein